MWCTPSKKARYIRAKGCCASRPGVDRASTEDFLSNSSHRSAETLHVREGGPGVGEGALGRQVSWPRGRGGTVTEARDGVGQRSQVTLKTAFTVCFAVLGVVALVALVMRTQVALTLTGIAALLALAMEHGVSRLERLGLPRMLSIALVMTGLLAVLVTLAFLVVPAAVAQVDALVLQWPQLWDELRASRPIRLLSERLHNLGWTRRLEEATPRLAGGTTLPELVVLAIG
ncbi:AI-2E family transporter, partial [Pyxidicoccus fallax]|nr:AI-2E family transporter [Pyxidicoccus fallax]